MISGGVTISKTTCVNLHDLSYSNYVSKMINILMKVKDLVGRIKRPGAPCNLNLFGLFLLGLSFKKRLVVFIVCITNEHNLEVSKKFSSTERARDQLILKAL